MDNYISAKEQAERELCDKCFNAGLDKRDTQIAVDFFINRLCHKEMTVKYLMGYQASLNKKCDFKRILTYEK